MKCFERLSLRTTTFTSSVLCELCSFSCKNNVQGAFLQRSFLTQQYAVEDNQQSTGSSLPQRNKQSKRGASKKRHEGQRPMATLCILKSEAESTLLLHSHLGRQDPIPLWSWCANACTKKKVLAQRFVRHARQQCLLHCFAIGWLEAMISCPDQMSPGNRASLNYGGHRNAVPLQVLQSRQRRRQRRISGSACRA